MADPAPAPARDNNNATTTSRGSVVHRSKGTTATQRLTQDYMRIMRDPVPYVTAHPVPHNLLEWHYVVRGPERTAYEGGVYQGKLIFPSEFPFKPPAIYILTPNGRFKTNVRLCLSISDYHPDTWNPAWSVSTILTGLLSFMMEDKPTMGSITTSDYEKRVLAKQSLDFNLSNRLFNELFPDIVAEIHERKKRLLMQQQLQQQQSSNSTSQSVAGRVSDLGKTIRSMRVAAQDKKNMDSSSLSSFISTTVVLVVFVAFLYTVRYVLNTIDSQSVGSGSPSAS